MKTEILVCRCPLWRPASANVAPNNSALVTFSQAEGDPMRNGPSIHPIPSQTGQLLSNYSKYPSTYPQGSPAVLGPTTSTRSCECSARHGSDVLCFINKDSFSLPLINLKRLRGTILSVLWQEIMKRTIIMCKHTFDSWNKRQTRDFLKITGNCYLDFHPKSKSRS